MHIETLLLQPHDHSWLILAYTWLMIYQLSSQQTFLTVQPSKPSDLNKQINVDPRTISYYAHSTGQRQIDISIQQG